MNNKLKNHQPIEKKISHNFIPFYNQIETLIIASLAFFIISLFFAQSFMSVNEEYHAYLNKAIRYEGVFQQNERVEVKATLQRP